MCQQEPFLPLLLDDVSAHKADTRLKMFADRHEKKNKKLMVSIATVYT
jgi:phosphoribosylcarboxyaminoimidazole (NCAIR) mutase